MSLTLWLPSGVRGRLACHVIVDGSTGEQCAATFDDAPALQRHVIACAARHIDEIREMSPIHKARGTIFDEEQWDPDLQRHMLGVGKRMLKDGDYTVKPRERAGF